MRRRANDPKPETFIFAIIVMVILLLVIVVAGTYDPERFVVSNSPCIIIGPATHPDLVGPHLLVDCNGTQFGVKVVNP